MRFQRNETRVRGLSGLLGVAALALGLGACGQKAPGLERNLLFVVFDTTRADHLSTYGYLRSDPTLGPTSPNLDALAARGARFDGARSVSSLTPVSAASFLTGELPTKTAVRSLFLFSKLPLAKDVTTLAELLADSGRRTAGFVSAPPIGSHYGFERGFDVFDDEVKGHAEKLRAQKVGNAFQRRSDETTDRALAWLEAADDGPFGLFVHYFDAHDPSLVPPRSYLAERVSFELPEDLDERGHLAELFDGAAPGQGGPRAADLIELYDAEIEYMDAQLGRLFSSLAASGRLDNTLVVLIADHGESLGQHDFWTHGLMWDEELRVPLILAGPGVPAGREVSDLVSLVDLVPSLADLLGLEPPAGIHGRSFAPLLEPGATLPPRPVFSEVHNSPDDRTGRPAAQFAVTALPWKLIVEPGRDPRLFDLAADPGELTDLWTPEHPAARALGAALAGSGLVTGAQLPGLDELDEAEREMLEKLGYL